jgi:predicted nuclease of predicted toxin-antitoxin system
LRELGHQAIHTLDLPAQNRASDQDINDLSMRDHCIVITKDADFVNSFLTIQKPYKLLLVSTGNLTNAELEALGVIRNKEPALY